MRVLGLGRGDAACVLVGAVGLVVAFSCLVEGVLGGEAHQTFRSLQPLEGTGDGDAANVAVCASGSDLQLTATKGTPLRFKCGEQWSLRPQKKDTEFVDVYQYTVDDSSRKSCQSAESPVTLAQAVGGAKLTEERKQPNSRNPESSTTGPVYTFNYTTEPEKEQRLCYTCTTATSTDTSPGGGVPGAYSTNDQEAPKETVKCTVYITVPKKETTTTSSSTPVPDSPSGAPAMSAAVATAIGGSLAVVLHM